MPSNHNIIKMENKKKRTSESMSLAEHLTIMLLFFKI